jgi:hypothetical protein
MKTNENTKNESSSNQNFAAACFGACEKIAHQLSQAKASLVAEFKDALKNREELLRNAIVEADALAWQTDYPHLLFPSLANEKLQTALGWQLRQQSLLRLQPAYARKA